MTATNRWHQIMKTGFLYTTAVFCVGVLYTAESCNVEIVATANPSNITSPGYPNRVYHDNLNCWWKVVAANRDNNVVVEVVDSAIQSSNNCIYARLTFNDGLNSSSPRIATTCGTQRGAYISTGNSMYIQFTTYSRRALRGILLKVYETPKCGGEITATSNSAALVSPGHPDPYLNNMRCTWMITTENENDTVVLDVIRSDIQESANCIHDSVTVYNGNATNANDSLGKFCGYGSPSFQSSMNQLMIVFISDGSVVKSGFQMRYKSVEADYCNRTMIIYPHTLYFASPGFPGAVHSDMTCVWIIMSREYQGIILQTITTDIEDSDDCANGSVTVYSGYMSKELRTFCGNNTFFYVSDEAVTTIVFKTGDTVIGNGIRFSYRSISNSAARTQTIAPSPSCGSTSLTAHSVPQYLQSPGYPLVYSNNQHCFWTIQAATSYMMIRIVVLDSNLERQSDCSYDYIKVYDGSSTLSPLMQTWCGNMKPTVQSSRDVMFLEFKTDRTNVFKGFRLKYFQTSEPFSCGGHLLAGATSTTLTSPGFPGSYLNNLDCVWTIHTVYDNIKIDVLQSGIEPSSSCSFDYVKVNDGSGTSSQLLGKFCGTQTPAYYSSGQYVTITFHSDNSNVNMGFNLEYTGGTFSPCSEQDLVAYTYNSNDITSPNYPSNYPSNADCTWRIDTADSDYVVSIDVLTSHIESSVGCVYDYVEAFDGFDDSATSLGRWCGYEVPDKQSSGRYMFIKFHTDGSNTATGFKISYVANLNTIIPIPIPTLNPVPDFDTDWDDDDDDDTTNVGGIAAGTVGSVVFLAIICAIAAAANKSSRPIVTRVQDNQEGASSVFTLNHRSSGTTVTPAVFQPPPAYCQVVTGEQRRAVGTLASLPPQPKTGVASNTAPVVNQQKY